MSAAAQSSSIMANRQHSTSMSDKKAKSIVFSDNNDEIDLSELSRMNEHLDKQMDQIEVENKQQRPMKRETIIKKKSSSFDEAVEERDDDDDGGDGDERSENWLSEEMIKKNLTNLGRTADGSRMAYLNLALPGFNLTSIKHIVNFKELQNLDLSYNQLKGK